MEPICNHPGTVKGIEVLFFEEAELTKTKASETSFAASGSLSVLYFPAYHRFVLQLNDWRYPILRRHPVASPEEGSYMLPAKNNFFYNLSIKSKQGQSIANLEAILKGTRNLESSPDDKLVRQSMTRKETGIKEIIGETIKQAIHKVQNKAATFKTGTKHLTSTKKMVNLKDIKNKNFKKDAHSKLKKDFFNSNEKLTNEFLQKRKANQNLTQAKEFEALKKTHDAPLMYLPKEEIENAILDAKDIFHIPKEMPLEAQDKKGLMTSLKENLRGVANRDPSVPDVQSFKTPTSAEGMTHYQG